MALPGRQLKPDGEKVTRHAPTHPWVEIPNVPYRGPRPEIPYDRLPKDVLEWWDAISTMPHCTLWDATMWQFAVATVPYRLALALGELSAGVELRRREDEMGVTQSAKMRLRLRYVDPAPATSAPEERPKYDPTKITDLERERARRLRGAG